MKVKRIGILTIIDNDNYGNRLQNYAVQTVIKKLNVDCETILNNDYSNCRNFHLLRTIKYKLLSKVQKHNGERQKNFKLFNKYITFSNKKVSPFIKCKRYDYVIAGSDQIWNPYIGRLREVDLLSFQNPKRRISFSASFGVDRIPTNKIKYTAKMLNTFKAISVREDSGKKIVEELTNRNDVEVLLDPTMLLTDAEWDKISSMPKMFNINKYILCYFLGDLSKKRRKEIEKVAKENGCEIINILDKSSPFYECGPSEFLWLEKNAFLICTDSFHSSVFAIIYNRPFVVFDREENMCDMSSRLDTLISKFKLNNRRYNGRSISKENLEHDYTNAYSILENERKKSIKFLEKALDIKDSERNEKK